MDKLLEFTVPVLANGLTVLEGYVAKAEEATRDGSFTEAAIVGARLAPDMMTFAGQIQRASDTTKIGIARIVGVHTPTFVDDETTLNELRERVRKTKRFLAEIDLGNSVPNDNAIEFKFGPVHKRFSRDQYVQRFLLPNFFFHVSTAHAILRHLGIRVGKLNYLGLS